MKTKVLYHGPWCPDGFAAAYCAWSVLGDSAEYIPVEYQQPPPPIERGDRIFIVDFSYPRQTLVEMESVAEGIIVLDHHKTAKEQLLGLHFTLFNLEKSGAMLAWEFWHPDESVPDLIRYVQDRDLWRHELPYTEEVHMALREYPREFPVWHRLATMPDFVERLTEEGTPLLAAKREEVRAKASSHHWEVIGGYKVPVVEAKHYYSDIANLLCRWYPESPFTACYRFDESGRKKWDLRSIGSFDVSAIAQQYGGGGHRNAAGFSEQTVESGDRK